MTIAHFPSSPDKFEAMLASISKDFARTASAHDRSGIFPIENIQRLHAEGLIGIVAPRDLGGGGADLATTFRIVQAVARGEPATALVLVMTYLTMRGFGERAHWPEHLRRQIVADVLNNGALVNSLRVEPELGTPARGGLPSTIARRVGNEWRISGRKIFSTGSTALSWMLVWARTDEETPRVGRFLVHRSAPGRHVEETWDHLGLRASASHDVIFDDVPTPLDHALSLRAPGEPERVSSTFSAWNVVLTSAIYDAVAQAARDWFIGWAASRVPANLGAPLSTLPRYQEAVGTVDGLLLSNRALFDNAIAGGLSTTETGLLKHLVTENAIAAVDKLVSLSGNPGLTRANALERHHRDVLCGRVHTPQADIVLGAAGRAAFGALTANAVTAEQ